MVGVRHLFGAGCVRCPGVRVACRGWQSRFRSESVLPEVMIIRQVPKLHPASSIFYYIRWKQSDLGDSVTISSSDWGRIDAGAFVATIPVGLSEDDDYLSGLTTGVRLSAVTLTEGAYYDVTNQIVTSAGETLHETIRITVSLEGH
jgi:hypothetical protein